MLLGFSVKQILDRLGEVDEYYQPKLSTRTYCRSVIINKINKAKTFSEIFEFSLDRFFTATPWSPKALYDKVMINRLERETITFTVVDVKGALETLFVLFPSTALLFTCPLSDRVLFTFDLLYDGPLKKLKAKHTL